MLAALLANQVEIIVTGSGVSRLNKRHMRIPIEEVIEHDDDEIAEALTMIEMLSASVKITVH